MNDCVMPGTPDPNQPNLMAYLHHLSGQEKEVRIFDADHTYARAWNRHPDANIKARSAKFLFMKHFPKHFLRGPLGNDAIDVVEVNPSPFQDGLDPFIAEVQALTPRTPTTPSFGPGLNEEAHMLVEKPLADKRNWSQTKHKLWAKSLRILQGDRLARLVCEGKVDEVIVKRNLIEKAASRFRQAFAAIAAWDASLLSWLHSTLHSHVISIYLVTYHEAMQILRQKVPSLVDKFYLPLKYDSGAIARSKQMQSDPVLTALNNHRPKRIGGSPLFLIVPNGPQIPHHFTSQRMKHWHNLFGSLGKVITVTVTQKHHNRALDCLYDIRHAVRDKIKECKATFNEGRPLVLVGFGASSLIAAHCALDNSANITATVCLGFPLTGVNGFRGDLDDPLLETTVPTLFVIGQNSTMCALDDIEDFRERIIKTETGLVVVGGCNDRLIVCSSKKSTDVITQGIVDRCIADEIYEFVSCIINPNSSADHYAPGASTHNRTSSGSKSPSSARSSPLNSTPGVVAKKKRKYVRRADRVTPE